jgi:hypothetical protein
MKTKKLKYGLIIIFSGLLLTLNVFAFILEDKKYQKDIHYNNEREVKVNIESAFGRVNVQRGEKDYIVQMEIISDTKHGDPLRYVNYDVRDKIGFLTIPGDGESSGKKSFHFSGFDSRKTYLDFTDKIPISFDIELGAGKGNFDFTGLIVKDLNISTGASSVEIAFDKPNPSTIDYMNIETGVSKFKARNLSNANFNSLRFSGGVGTYSLDFGGTLNKEVDVHIEIGLGSLTLEIPEYIGAKIMYEKNWLSGIDLDSEFSEKSENEYQTDNYFNTKGRMNIKIEAGLGSVKVKVTK